MALLLSTHSAVHKSVIQSFIVLRRYDSYWSGVFSIFTWSIASIHVGYKIRCRNN